MSIGYTPIKLRDDKEKSPVSQTQKPIKASGGYIPVAERSGTTKKPTITTNTKITSPVKTDPIGADLYQKNNNDSSVKVVVGNKTIYEPKKKNTFGSVYNKISNTSGNIAASFVTGFGEMTGSIIDQVLNLAQGTLKTPQKQREQLADMVSKKGIPDEKNIFNKKPLVNTAKAGDFINDQRKKLKENVATGVQISEETNPISGTFAGKTSKIVGGMVPQVALAFAKAPQVALSLSESFMNAEQSYDENVKNGMNEKKARARVLPQLSADLFGTYLTNKFGSLGKFSGEGSVLFKFGKNTAGKIASRILEVTKDAGLEVLQEVYQQGLQNIATNKPFTDGMGETAKLTILPSLLFGGAGNIAEYSKSKEKQKQEIIDKVAFVNAKVENNIPLDEQETVIYAATKGKDPFVDSPKLIEDDDLIKESNNDSVNIDDRNTAVNDLAETQNIKEAYVDSNKEVVQTISNEDGLTGEISIVPYPNGKFGVVANVQDIDGNSFDLPVETVVFSDKDKAISHAQEQINNWSQEQGITNPKFNSVDQKNIDEIQDKTPSNVQKMVPESKDNAKDDTLPKNETETVTEAKMDVSEDEQKQILKSTEKGRKQAINEPVAIPNNETEQSGVRQSQRYQSLLKRMTDDQRAKLEADGVGKNDPRYTQLDMSEDAQRAMDFIEQQPDVAQKIAEGKELPPENILREHIASALIGKYLADGNIEAWKNLATSQTLRGTRYGQEIASFRGTNDPSNPEYWIDQAINNRLQKEQGSNAFTYLYEKTLGQKRETTPLRKKIDANTRVINERLKRDRLKIEEAEDLLNSILC